MVYNFKFREPSFEALLQEEREYHVSWTVEEGTVLMGGFWSGATSEIVKQDGTTERSFDMKYDTEYDTIQYNFYSIFIINN